MKFLYIYKRKNKRKKIKRNNFVLIVLFTILLSSLVSAVTIDDIKENLVFYASMDTNCTGDNSIYENQGTVTGTPDWKASGKVNGKCYTGASEYMVFTDSTQYNSLSTDFTVASWINVSADANYKVLWGNYASDQGVAGYVSHTSLAKYYSDDNSGGGIYTNSAGSVCDNSWHYIVFVKNLTHSMIYTDGVIGTPIANTQDIHPGEDLRLGGYSAAARDLLGDIDEFVMANISWTKDKIDFMYNGGAGRSLEAPKIPPVISDICCTSPDPDSCTEPYDTGGDLTPTFNFTTDLTATCYIGDDNATWTVCSTTTVAGEHICTEPATHPLVFGADKVYLNCSGSGGDTYDELNVASSYLAGNVTDSSNRLISGALVTASKNNTPTIWDSNITDVNGYWVIGVSPGPYTICSYDPNNGSLRGDCTPHVVVT